MKTDPELAFAKQYATRYKLAEAIEPVVQSIERHMLMAIHVTGRTKIDGITPVDATANLLLGINNEKAKR